MRWKVLTLCYLLLCGWGLGGCMAKTQARLTYTAAGMPDVTFFDNKTRNGVKLTVTPNAPGEAPTIVYEVKSSDANSVALEALGVAKATTGLLAAGAGLLVKGP